MTIINATVYTMDGPPIESGFVQVQEGKILRVGPMEQYPGDSHELDARGGVVLPGLVDIHTHLGLFEEGISFEGEDGNEDTSPTTPHLRVLDGINPMDVAFEEALAAGVTTVAVAPGSANPIGGQILLMKTAGHCVDKMLLKEPLAMKLALGENPKCTYNSKNQMPVTRMATAALIRESLKKAQDYYDQKEKAQLEEDDADDVEFDMECESLIPVILGQIPVHVHAHRADDIFTALRLAQEFELQCVIVHGTEGHKIAPELAEAGVPVIVGPVLTDRSKPELREQSLETAGILARAGVKVALCTDHPETPLKFFTLCGALCVKYGMDREEALRAMTRNPAEIVGMGDRIGSLRPGMDADLIVCDGDPLDLYTNVTHVMVNGKLVKGDETA
ncbi:MAG: amidohydrolase [Eubacteriales bacterium]|jgi:imidazolonepropionase-like amidohydrolase